MDRHCFGPADVTVVVPTHETEPARVYDILRHCLDTAGVMFVDDGSGTPLSGVRGAMLVRLRHNSGPAAARNAGARAAETPIVAFVDTDVDLHPGWLDGLLWHFDDPGVGFVAPRVASSPAADGGDERVARYEQRHSPLDIGTEPGRIVAGTRISYVPAATLLVRKQALDEIGGFDATLRIGEDVDAVWRLGAAGWRGRYEPSVVVHHQPRRTWRQLAVQRRAYGESAAALAVRHGNAVAPVRMSPWSFGVWGLAAIGRPFTAAGVAGATALALIPKLRGVPAGESLRLAGTGHLAAGGSLATAVRRVWMPLVGLGAVCSQRGRWVAAAAIVPAIIRGGPARLLDDASYGVGVWKGVLGRRRLTPLLPSPHRVAPAGRHRSVDPSQYPPSQGVGLTLRLTVDRVAWRAHVEHLAGSYSAAAANCVVVPVVKGNGYGFGRNVLARVADDLVAMVGRGDRPPVIAVGSVHELSGLPSRLRPVVLTPPGAAAAPRLRSAHHNPIVTIGDQCPRRCARRLARRGAHQAGIVDAPLRCGTPRARRLRPHGADGRADRDRLQHPPPARRRRRRTCRRGRALAGGARHPAPGVGQPSCVVGEPPRA